MVGCPSASRLAPATRPRPHWIARSLTLGVSLLSDTRLSSLLPAIDVEGGEGEIARRVRRTPSRTTAPRQPRLYRGMRGQP